MKRVHLESAYVLHRRPYRETSCLVELLTPTYGRLSAIAKGVRKPGSSLQGILQPFIPLLVSWSGKNELMYLSQVETQGEAKHLKGECLFAGFYLNELLIALLQKWDAHPNLYTFYEKTLKALQVDRLEQRILRSFEKYLLEELGYGLLPKSEVSLHNTFSKDKYYQFTSEQGFVLSEGTGQANMRNIFSGKSLLKIAKEEWQESETLQDAKRLIRCVLAPLLGTRPIYSRRLFMQPDGEGKHEE